MNTPSQRWSPSHVRRIAAATGPLALRDFAVIGERGSEPHFSMPVVAQYADPTINALFEVERTYARGDARLFEAAGRYGIDASKLFSPSPDSVHIPTYQPGMLVRHRNNAMVANSLMPVVKVGNRSNVIASVPFGTGLGATDTRLASQGGSVPELTWKVSNQGTFLVEDFGLMTFIPKQVSENADAPFIEVRQTTAEILGDTLELMQEIEVAATIGTAGNYASGYSTTISTSTDKWNNDASDPADQVRTGVAKILRAPGTRLVMVLGRDVFRALQKHPKILAAFYGRAGTVLGPTPALASREFLATLFEVDEVVVGVAKKNTANDGQTVALSDVWTNLAAVVCVQERPSIIRTNAFGYQFRFMSEAMNVQFIPWLLPGVAGGEYCKVTHSTDTFVTSNVSGYLWATVLA